MTKYVIKRINRSQYLSKHYGGKWKYDGVCSWWCDDGKRHVSRVSSSSSDEVEGYPLCYYMYDTDVSILTKQVRFY